MGPEAWLAPALASASATLGVAALAVGRAKVAAGRAGAGRRPRGRAGAGAGAGGGAGRDPRGVAGLLSPLGRAAVRAGLVSRDALATRLAAAEGRRTGGRPSEAADRPAGVEPLAGGKVALGLLAAAAGVAAGAAAVAPAVGAIAFLGPDLILARRARRRRARCDAEVPQLLDLLAAASSAGLAAPLALRRAAEALRGPLGEELRAVAVAAELGARWREELARCADRVGSRDLRRAVVLLSRTERLGTSLARASVELADRVRARRRAEAAERARRAPVLMLFPLVFLILPAFLLLTVVPVLLTTVRSIG